MLLKVYKDMINISNSELNDLINKYGIEIFYTAFKEACGEDFDKDHNDGILDNTKFYYAIVLLSKVLFT